MSKQPLLTNEQFEKMAHSFTRLQEINEAKIQSPTDAAEAKGIVEYLAEEFLAHASEFLGMWSVVRKEYEPAVVAFSHIADRIHAIRVSRVVAAQQREQAAQTTQPAQPANVTSLIQP